MEIFGKVNHLRNFLRLKICVYENYLWKNAVMNESAILPRIHARALPVFLSQRFGTGVETRQTFHYRLAACIKTTRLSRKDCLAGYRYKKTAVINEHYTLNSLLML